MKSRGTAARKAIPSSLEPSARIPKAKAGRSRRMLMGPSPPRTRTDARSDRRRKRVASRSPRVARSETAFWAPGWTAKSIPAAREPALPAPKALARAATQAQQATCRATFRAR